MTDKAKKLITEFKEQGGNTPAPYKKLSDLTKNAADIYSFCKQYLIEFKTGSTIFDTALSYLEKEQFADLINSAIHISKNEDNQNVESVIAYASLQFPDLLHDYLEQIIELQLNKNHYYPNHHWRNLSSEKIELFKNIFKNKKTPIARKHLLFNCLLETRDIETIKFAYQFALDNQLYDKTYLKDRFYEESDLTGYLNSSVEDVGYTMKNGTLVSYCPNETYHLCFPKNYFPERSIHTHEVLHPTWQLPPIETSFELGGLIQDDENNPFIHIITFDPIPQGIKISALKKLTIGLHISEMNEYGILFYKHDSCGNPQKMGDVKQIEGYVDLPIKKTRVSLSKTPERWKFQNSMLSNGRENLFRLGGEPAWEQGADVLTCPICHEKMDFLMQLDSELPNVENDEILFGSGGICYVFWCDKSKVSGFLFQGT